LGAIAVSTDDLENYEAELRLLLYREYRDVVGMFRYVVETERGVYLANEVDSRSEDTGGRPRIVLDLRDAWVWDMYRPQRFVPSVRIVTFRDVVVEEIASTELDVTKAGLDDPGQAGHAPPPSGPPAATAGETPRPTDPTRPIDPPGTAGPTSSGGTGTGGSSGAPGRPSENNTDGDST
jgi:hypothetical protein